MRLLLLPFGHAVPLRDVMAIPLVPLATILAALAADGRGALPLRISRAEIRRRLKKIAKFAEQMRKPEESFDDEECQRRILDRFDQVEEILGEL